MEEFLYSVYDTLHVNRSLLDDLYNATLLTPLTLATLGLALGFALLYYFLMDRARFARLTPWALMLTGASLLTALVVYQVCARQAHNVRQRDPNNPSLGVYFDQGGGVFFTYALLLLVLCAVFYVLFSVLLRKFSTHLRFVPF
jgi:hypothetical protein